MDVMLRGDGLLTVERLEEMEALGVGRWMLPKYGQVRFGQSYLTIFLAAEKSPSPKDVDIISLSEYNVVSEIRTDEERTYFLTTIHVHPEFVHQGDT